MGSVKAFIFRKRNGQLHVNPSPVVLAKGDDLVLVNLTGMPGNATFDETVLGCTGGKRVERIDSSPTSPTTVKISPTPPYRYFEYDVVFDNGEYAEGGSKPGGIVDP